MFDACVTAYDLIDLQQHAGGHPRLGSVDLVPIHPLSIDVSLDECGTIARGNQNPGLFDRHINIIYRGGGKGDGGGGGGVMAASLLLPKFYSNFIFLHTQIPEFAPTIFLDTSILYVSDYIHNISIGKLFQSYGVKGILQPHLYRTVLIVICKLQNEDML